MVEVGLQAALSTRHKRMCRHCDATKFLQGPPAACLLAALLSGLASVGIEHDVAP